MGQESVLQCHVCGILTTHHNNACGRCWTKQPAPGQILAVQHSPPGFIRTRSVVMFGLFVALVLLVAGFCHIVYGGNVGLTMCEKDGWSLSDTFVDLDDYIGKPLISQLGKAKVLRAMFSCGTLQRPSFHDE